jgi:transposase
MKADRHMNVHHSARLTSRGRERILRAILAQQLSAKAAALQVGLSERSVRKWLARFRGGLPDRSSRPRRSLRQTPAAQVALVLALRRCVPQASRLRARVGSPAPPSRACCAGMDMLD